MRSNCLSLPTGALALPVCASLSVALLALNVPAFAQTAKAPAKPAVKLPAATLILDQASAATGSKSDLAKINSEVSEGTLEVTAQKITGKFEQKMKMPDKILTTGDIQGIGHTAQGYDGKVGWSEDPMNGIRLLTGQELVQTRQEVTNLKSDWRSEFKSAVMIGIRTVGTAPAYAIRLVPKAEGSKPVVNFYDVKSKLLVRADMILESPQGSIPTQNFFTDYRTVSGIKLPFLTRQVIGLQELLIKLQTVQFNVPVDDAIFTKPSAPAAPAPKQ